MNKILDKVKVIENADGSITIRKFVKGQHRVQVRVVIRRTLSDKSIRNDESLIVMTFNQYEKFMRRVNRLPEERRPDVSMVPLETEDEFIAREFDRIQAVKPHLQGRPVRDKLVTELPADISNRKKWRLKQNGDIFVNNTVELPEEVQNAKKKAIRAKLKSGQALTDEEADILLP